MENTDKKNKLLDEACKIYADFLRHQGMFFTKERQIIVQSILEHKEHFSADELFFDLQKQSKKVSRATMYRSLAQLVECGVLSEADFGHGHSHFELAMGGQKHAHLICRQTQLKPESSKKPFKSNL